MFDNVKVPKTNFELEFGNAPNHILINFTVKKTLINRLKWFLFCLVFPCRVRRWEVL